MTGATSAAIIEWVVEETHVARREILSHNREPRVVRARSLVVWGAQAVLGLTAAEISRVVRHERRYAGQAWSRVLRLIDEDAAFQDAAGRLYAHFMMQVAA